MDSRNVTATFFITGYGNSDFPINGSQEPYKSMLHDLEQRSFEIASHTFNHKRVKDFIADYGLNEWINEEVKSSLCLMIDDGFSIYSFAYPNSNSNSAESDEALLKIFEVIRLYNGRESNHWAGIVNPNESVIMGSAIDEEILNLPELEKVIDSIAENNQSLVLAAHDLIESKELGLYIKPKTLEHIIDYALSKGVVFTNMKDTVSPKAKKVDNSVCE